VAAEELQGEAQAEEAEEAVVGQKAAVVDGEAGEHQVAEQGRLMI